jgi:hypothetical protein
MDPDCGERRGGRATDLLAIFGPAGQRLVASGDLVAERNARGRFAASHDQRHLVGRGAGGEGDWPYPIPIVRQAAGWRFDVSAGVEQILDRRDSGVMTVVVNQNGIVVEKNLGPETARIARQTTAYDPDRRWKIAQP